MNQLTRNSTTSPLARARRALGVLTALAVTLAVLVTLTPALAFAQEFVKVEGKAGQDVPAGPFVGIAYGFIWIAILSYVVFVARGVARVRGDIAELRRQVDAASKR